MTVIQNTLLSPTGAPLAGALVSATLVSSGGFTDDGRVTGRASTYTDDTGAWQLDLTPQSAIDQDGTYYRIVERSDVWHIVVPDSGTHLLETVLVEPVPDATGATAALTLTAADARYVQIGHETGGAPSGAAGGALSGTYPNPGIADGAVTPAKLDRAYDPAGAAAAAVAGIPSGAAAGTPSLRALGSGATDAAAGNDTRLSDARSPLPHATTHGSAGSDPVTPAAIGAATTGHNHTGTYDPAGTAAAAVAAIPADPVAGTAGLRTLGTGSQQAAAGNHTHGGFKAAATTGPLRLAAFTANGGNGGGWQLWPASYRLTVPAAVGDVLVWTAAVLANGGPTEGDLVSVVSGAPARYLSSGTGVQGANGHGGFYQDGTFGTGQLPAVTWVVAAEDIDAGSVTLSPLYHDAGGRAFGSSAYSSHIDLVNLGQPQGG